MSDLEETEIVVSIDEWVDKAKADPRAYLERQATEIFLTALGTTEPYCGKFFLKGGLLMGIVYNSPRQTADIDYSTILEPDAKIVDHLKQTLNDALPAVAANMGYPDLICKIQTITVRPREDIFTTANAPGFQITIAYAKRGTNEAKKLEGGKGPVTLYADVSFKEPIGAIQIVRFGNNGPAINAYSLKDMIAEKLRAFLQQEKRKRARRQDIYDLSILLGKFTFDDEEKKEILDLLLTKCKVRDISPDKASFGNEELVRRAKSEWDTMELEIGELPSFEECYKIAKDFYESLPWDNVSLLEQ